MEHDQIFADPEKAQTFARDFLKLYTYPAFGAISKSEVDNLVFRLLTEVGAVNPNGPIYKIAKDLNITPQRARNLLFQWQMRMTKDDDVLREQLAECLSSVRFAKDGDLLSFGIESPLLREEMRARLKEMGVYADSSFASEIVRLPVERFVEFLDDFLPAQHKENMREALVRDKQIADVSFKGIATAVLKKVATRAIGKIGDELVDGALEEAGELISGLIKGDGEKVARIAAPIEI